MNKKIYKGDIGYLAARKKRVLLITLLEFAVTGGIFVLGYWQTGSERNLLSVVAAVGCLPSVKNLVSFIVMIPHKSLRAEKIREIEKKAGLVTRLYDALLTCDDKITALSSVVIYNRFVCGYTESNRVNTAHLETYIRGLCEKEGYQGLTVRVFQDYSAFTSRIEGMNNIAAVEKKIPDEDLNIARCILSVSM